MKSTLTLLAALATIAGFTPTLPANAQVTTEGNCHFMGDNMVRESLRDLGNCRITLSPSGSAISTQQGVSRFSLDRTVFSRPERTIWAVTWVGAPATLTRDENGYCLIDPATREQLCLDLPYAPFSHYQENP